MKKYLIISFSITIIASLLAIVFIPNILAQSIESSLPMLSKQIDKEITVGSINLNWKGKCQISDLRIKDKSGDILDAKMAIADIGLMPLLDNKILINQFTLESATLTIRNNDGDLNISKPGSKKDPSVIELPEIDEQKQKWIKAIWKAISEYLDKENSDDGSAGPVSDEWTFGLDSLICKDLNLVMADKEKEYEFKSSLTLEGCGVSDKAFICQLKGPEKNPFEFTWIDGQITASKIVVQRRSSKEFKCDGHFSLMLKNSSDNSYTGKYKVDGISYHYHEKLAPLENLVLTGTFSGKDSELKWKVDKEFYDSLKVSAINSAEQQARIELEKRGIKDIDSAIEKGLGRLFKKIK